jgi:hypothetical protein
MVNWQHTQSTGSVVIGALMHSLPFISFHDDQLPVSAQSIPGTESTLIVLGQCAVGDGECHFHSVFFVSALLQCARNADHHIFCYSLLNGCSCVLPLAAISCQKTKNRDSNSIQKIPEIRADSLSHIKLLWICENRMRL